MLDKLKPRSGRYTGDEYQRWMGVRLICEWFLETSIHKNDPPWLEEEIGINEYGIFDDILMYKNAIYYFYQIKHTISIIGDTIKIGHLTKENKTSKISIDKIFESYCKIKTQINSNQFEMIVCSNKSVDSSLESIIGKDGKFKENFINGNLKESNLNIRNKFFELCGRPDGFNNFLNKISFIRPYLNPELESKRISPLSDNFLNLIYNLVDRTTKNPNFKIFFNTPIIQQIFMQEQKFESLTLKTGIFSYHPIPKAETFDYELDLFTLIQNNPNWNIIRDNIDNLKETIMNTSTIRSLMIIAKIHLTIGYMIGFVFRKTTGFYLSIKQLDDLWTYSNSENKRYLKVKLKRINKNSNILVVLINIGENDLNTPVSNYLNENKINSGYTLSFSYKKLIKNNEISSMINQITKKIKSVNKKGIEEIHIFNSIPLGMAIFLGYNFNVISPVHIYEFDKKKHNYKKSIILR